MCLGFKTGVAGWETKMNPLSYGSTQCVKMLVNCTHPDSFAACPQPDHDGRAGGGEKKKHVKEVVVLSQSWQIGVEKFLHQVVRRHLHPFQDRLLGRVHDRVVLKMEGTQGMHAG